MDPKRARIREMRALEALVERVTNVEVTLEALLKRIPDPDEFPPLPAKTPPKTRKAEADASS